MIKRLLLQLIILAVAICGGDANATPKNSFGFEQATWEPGYQSGGAFLSVQSTDVRSGTYALTVSPTTTNTASVVVTAFSGSGANSDSQPASADAWYRVYAKIITAPASGDEEFICPQDGGPGDKWCLRLNSSRQVAAYNNAGTLIATGTTVLPLNTWIQFGLRSGNGASATYGVQLDQVTELSGTANLGATNNGGIRLGKNTNRNSQGYTIIFDDGAVDDAAYPPAGKVVMLRPNGNGATHNWTLGTNTSGFGEIDETGAIDTTDYVQKNTSITQISEFDLENSSVQSISGTIYTLKAMAAYAKTGAGPISFFFGVNSGGFTSETTAHAYASTSFSNSGKVIPLDPATSAAWTTSGIDSVRLRIRDESTDNPKMARGFILVDYQPAAAVPRTRGGMTGGMRELSGGMN